MSALLCCVLLVLRLAPAALAQADEDGSALPLAALALSIRSRAIQDSRCYLMNGGAVESFFISEDTPVGSVIGTLSVNGDPRAVGGDITLSVQERGAGVALAPDSKNLTLQRALDREARAGPASLYVNVRCDRRATADPSFVIPVSVRAWDVNDNAPAWAGAPYRARVSELAARGARVLGAPASDPDAPGPHSTVHYAVLGPAAEYIEFANELDSTITIKQPLDYERARNVSATLRARDAADPFLYNDTTLFIEVLDADDQNPKFSRDHYVVEMPDVVEEGTELHPSSPIAAWDQDLGIAAPLRFSVAGGAVRARPDTGALLAGPALATATLPLTVVIKATQIDNSDRYALATVTIQRRAPRASPTANVREPPATPLAPTPREPPTSPAPSSPPQGEPVRFTQREFSATLSENAKIGSHVLTLTTAPRVDAPLQFYVSERSFLQWFAINGAGDVLLRAPPPRAPAALAYRVMLADGRTNDTASLNISIERVNEWEPRFRYPLYEFRVDLAADAAQELRVGRLDAFDGDDDQLTITLHGPHAHMFKMAPGGEVLVSRAELASLNNTELRLLATVADSANPPKQSSVPVSVHVVGLQSGERAPGGGSPGPLAASLGALILLALCVMALLAYICLRRRAPHAAHKAPPAAPALPPAPPGPPGAGALAGGGSGSLQSVSAGASTILDSCSSLDLRLHNGQQSHRSSKSKVAPAPVAPAPAGPTAAPAPPGSGPALMSDHVSGAAGGRSGVAWPSATIPARVKKLSWDDAAPPQEEGGAVEATNPALGEHMNLTVYF